jgi:uroporphyrinogen decarboxylase
MDYLRYQVECGAQIIQLFESLADRVTADEYRRFALPCHQRIFAELRGAVPTILFAREQPRVDLMADSGADVISVGRCVDIAQARLHIPDRVAVQGNVDNELLVNGTFAEIDGAVRRCIEAGRHHGHILNLNHGLLRETPLENVRRFVETARSFTVEEPSCEPPEAHRKPVEEHSS